MNAFGKFFDKNKKIITNYKKQNNVIFKRFVCQFFSNFHRHIIKYVLINFLCARIISI